MTRGGASLHVFRQNFQVAALPVAAYIPAMPDATAPSPSDDMLAALLAAPVPRKVPAELLRTANRQPLMLILVILGLGPTFLGLLAVWLFFPWGYQHDQQLNLGPTQHGSGRVTAQTQTNLSEGSSRSTEVPVYAYEFVFSPRGGAESKGICYTTGQKWASGSPVDVEYLAADPTVARITGSRTSEVSMDILVFLPPLFLATGLTLVITGLGLRRRRRWLLKNGVVGEGRVQSVGPLTGRVNRQPSPVPIFRITLLQTNPTVAQLHKVWALPLIQRQEIEFFQARLASQQPVFMLYDPARPKRVIFPETLLLK